MLILDQIVGFRCWGRSPSPWADLDPIHYEVSLDVLCGNPHTKSQLDPLRRLATTCIVTDRRSARRISRTRYRSRVKKSAVLNSVKFPVSQPAPHCHTIRYMQMEAT